MDYFLQKSHLVEETGYEVKIRNKSKNWKTSIINEKEHKLERIYE